MTQMKYINIDWSVVILYLLLVFLGWLSIYSSSYQALPNFNILDTGTIYGKQSLFIILSIITIFFILLIDLKLIIRLSYVIYFMSITSLILVLFFGKEVGGAKAWFNFGQFGLQPAEFAKFSTILALSKFIHDNKLKLSHSRNVIKVVIFILSPFLLILMQPDAGSALIYTSFVIVFFREGLKIEYVIFGLMLFVLSLLTIIMSIQAAVFFLFFISSCFAYLLYQNKKKIIPALLAFIIGAIIVSGINYSYEHLLQPHQKERIDLIIGKEKNDLGAGYNLNQSLIAIGSGGFFGKGYLNGTQTKFNFVPEQNTDFIFCTIGEEFGFVGSIFILVLFLSLITKIIFISERQSSRFSRIFGYSLASILFSHVLINISMTLGLMPVIGIPLPFFSYGGSSLLSFSMMLFTFLKLDAYRTYRF